MFLEGRVAIVTAGGGPGIGSAISRALAKEGATVVIAELDPTRASKVADEIKRAGGKALAVPTDVSKKSAVTAMVERAVREFGKVSILVNHAGLVPGGPIEQLGEETWDRTLAVHLKGNYLCSQAVVPHMKKERWGRIVNTSSRVAYKPTILGVSDYAAAKAGIVGFSRALAMEVGAWGITVNNIAPGLVSGSGMHAVAGRPARSPEETQKGIEAEHQILQPFREVTPEEIAGTVLYLVGPYAARVTGCTLHVNSGSYMPA